MEMRNGRRKEITDPATYLQKHDFKNEKIVYVTEQRVTDEREWKKYTNPDVHDNHIEEYVLRFQYTFKEPKNNYLMVDDDGNVSVCGGRNDERTFFKVTHDSINKTYQFICQGGRSKDHIFYMKGPKLKTRPSTRQDMKPSMNQDTLFEMRGVANDCMFEIISKQGNYQLKFDRETGKYILPTRKSENSNMSIPATFATFVTHKILVTSV